jgi:hypothetical protein
MAKKNAPVDLKKLIARAEAAWQRKLQWQGILDDAYEFCLPMRNRYSDKTEGSQKLDRVFDGTAIEAVQRFASRFQSQLTPPFQTWAVLSDGPLVPQEKKEQVRTQLQTINKQLFAAIHASNFDHMIGEVYLEGAISTAGMLILEGDDSSPLLMQAVPNYQFATDDGPMGSVDGAFRRWEAPVREIEETWTDAELPEDLARIGRDTPEQKVKLEEGTFYDSRAKKYAYVVWWKGGAKAEPHKIVERWYNEHPWVFFRWTKVAGEAMARGPALYVLPDIKTLNKVKELVLKNASLSVAGVWTAVDDGVINPDTIQITPGAVVEIGAQGNLQALQTGGRFDVSQFIIDDLQMTIKRALFDNQLPPDAGPVRSPTEIMERVKELQEETGAPFGRISHEFIRPLLQRCLNILVRKGIIQIPGADPAAPTPELKIDGLSVAIEITSPLARVQQMNDVDGVVNWLQISSFAGQEAVMGSVKVEDIPPWFADKLGIDLKLVRSESERAELQKAMAQMMAQQQMAQQAPQQGQ